MDLNSLESALLLEDQALIAIHVEELLQLAGYNDVSVQSSCAAAIEWLDSNNPKIAVIEARLRDGAADEVAAVLTARGIPYIVHSCEREANDRHPLMDGNCRWIDKPCDPELFIQAVRECAGFR